MKSPEVYRALAQGCLRRAETMPEGMRLSHIMIAQLWLELADKVTQTAARNRGQYLIVRWVEPIKRTIREVELKLK